MDTKWKSIKAGLSFCFLVISLTILVIFGGIGAIAMRSLDLRQIGDAFLADYQQTDDFRDVMEGYLLDGLEVAMFSSDGHLESLAQDRNLRYEIYYGNRLIESNTQEIGDSLKRRTAKGYNFYLKYEDGAVQIWKDGAELDVYGDGVYRGAWDQWDVPGYSNRSISDYLYDWITAQDPDEIRELFQHLERIRPSDFQTGQEYVNLNLLFWDGTYGYMEFKVRDQEAFQKFLSKKGEASF